MAPKLTARSKAVRLLREKFESGELSGHEDPKTVWASNDTFKQHKLDNFRTRYNKMRKEHFHPSPKGDGDVDDLNRPCVLDTEAKESKKRRFSERDDMEDGDSDVHVGTGEREHGDEDLIFKPLALPCTWEEPGTRAKRITVAIVLPSGVGPGNFSLQVGDEGQVLQLTVQWPAPLLDLQVMHRMWLLDTAKERMQVYHPKILGFERSLQRLRGRSSDSIQSTARISLPFAVESHIDSKINLAFRESETKLLYVDLKAAVEGYAINNDSEEFIIT